jgi:hypothetical protein
VPHLAKFSGDGSDTGDRHLRSIPPHRLQQDQDSAVKLKWPPLGGIVSE